MTIRLLRVWKHVDLWFMNPETDKKILKSENYKKLTENPTTGRQNNRSLKNVKGCHGRPKQNHLDVFLCKKAPFWSP